MSDHEYITDQIMIIYSESFVQNTKHLTMSTCKTTAEGTVVCLLIVHQLKHHHVMQTE